jgi:hypothetical protein
MATKRDIELGKSYDSDDADNRNSISTSERFYIPNSDKAVKVNVERPRNIRCPLPAEPIKKTSRPHVEPASKASRKLEAKLARRQLHAERVRDAQRKRSLKRLGE